VTLPFLEAAISASVVLFGAMLIAATRPMPVGLGLGLVAVAASLHGLAHGAESPGSAGFANYAAGFLLTTAALLAIFASLDRRPVVAGVLIGLLTVKPQLGILFPFALIASGRWRVFLWAAMTAVALFAISVAIGGLESWHDYIAKAMPLQREVLGDAAGTAVPFQSSIFMSVRGLVGNRAAEMIQLAFTVAAVTAVIAAFRYRKGGDARELQALFLACTASASPYLGSYDLLPLTFASVALLAEEKLDATGRRLAQLIFWVPALQLLLGHLQIPGAGFVAPAFAAYLLLRLFAPVVPSHATAAAAG
jgi:hypothetical protein